MKKAILILLALLFVLPVTALAEAPLQVGDTIELGLYEQDGKPQNGPEPIEWMVLDVDEEEGKALVVSWYSLDRLLYHSKYEPVTWEDCDLRRDLNSSFLNSVFTEEEIQRIQYAQLHTEDNPEMGTKGGNDTVDRIFVLSAEEADRYFTSTDDRRGQPTTYLTQLCSTTDGLQYTSTIWWLRTPGDLQSHASYVFGGVVNYHGWGGNIHKLPIRPAMWISME